MVNINPLSGPASDDSGTNNNVVTNVAATSMGNVSVLGAISEPSINATASPSAVRENEPQSSTQGTPPYENEEFIRGQYDVNERPGKRLKNPLGYLANYTYQLSLYMISPDAYDAFIVSGRKNVNLFNEQVVGTITDDNIDFSNRGVFLVAQSGGSPSGERTPEFKYDYYIDDLSFKHMVNSKETSAPTGMIDFNFKIIEPYGFSLITNLKKAQDKIRKTSTNNPSKQFFMLGIRFHGWDQSGRQVSGDEFFDGSPLDFAAPGNGSIFETFYDLVITSIKFKIDGKATTYSIKASLTPPTYAVNVRKGMITSTKEVSGSTVRDMLSGPNGLITLLNQEQQQLKNNGTLNIPTVYKIRWLGDSEEIAMSSVVLETRENLAVQPGSQADNTTEVNDATDLSSSPNNTQERLTFANSPILQVIDQIIARSKYLGDALTLNYTDANEFDPTTDSASSETTPNRKFTWFRITPEISNIQWDEKINDWSYTITYIIQKYLVPVLDNPYVANNTEYYGPHKRYEYWYTGKNTEIIQYEQTLDNAYFTTVLGNDPRSGLSNVNEEGNASSEPGSGAIIATNTPTGGDNTGAAGTSSMAAVNSVRTSLYDPASFASAKFSILGDPDYLMQEIPAGAPGLNQAFSRFYDGFTINPTGGQVFIEIDFKEGVDYSTSEVEDLIDNERGVTGVGGTMSINDSILFWDYPPNIKDRISGISYKLISITHSFKNGAFTQTLESVINQFGREPEAAGDEREPGTTATTASATETTGTLPDVETTGDVSEAVTIASEINAAQTITPET